MHESENWGISFLDIGLPKRLTVNLQSIPIDENDENIAGIVQRLLENNEINKIILPAPRTLFLIIRSHSRRERRFDNLPENSKQITNSIKWNKSNKLICDDWLCDSCCAAWQTNPFRIFDLLARFTLMEWIIKRIRTMEKSREIRRLGISGKSARIGDKSGEWLTSILENTRHSRDAGGIWPQTSWIQTFGKGFSKLAETFFVLAFEGKLHDSAIVYLWHKKKCLFVYFLFAFRNLGEAQSLVRGNILKSIQLLFDRCPDSILF
jgi:hypothetical protein